MRAAFTRVERQSEALVTLSIGCGEGTSHFTQISETGLILLCVDNDPSHTTCRETDNWITRWRLLLT